jgi:hypothetical protein
VEAAPANPPPKEVEATPAVVLPAAEDTPAESAGGGRGGRASPAAALDTCGDPLAGGDLLAGGDPLDTCGSARRGREAGMGAGR